MAPPKDGAGSSSGRWKDELAVAVVTDDVGAGFVALTRGASAGAGALRVASERGHEAMVELLLQHGADINSARDDDGVTCLHACVGRGDRDDVAKLLIRRGAAVSTRDKRGRTPLDAAMERGHIRDEELFMMLSDAGGVDNKGR
jgi:Arf-GAP/coiled-coil/ANK repeat/PH domain-containing protein